MTRDERQLGAPDAAQVERRRVSLRHRLEYAGLRCGTALARLLPISWSVRTGAAIGRLVGPKLRQNRRALENLEIAFPEKSDAERRAIARAMWANIGRIFAETLVFDRIAKDPARLQMIDRTGWRARLATPGPSIACTLHLGNWELAVCPLKAMGREPAGVYKPLENPLIDAWLRQTRAALYPGGLLGKGDNEDDMRAGQRTARALIDLARKGGCIGFVSDHFDRRGTPIPFMGRTGLFTVAPAMIARHVGARLWVGRCLRVGAESRFHLEIVELEVPHTKDKSADAVALTTSIFAQFEAWIRETPEQWMWWNTRWVNDDGTISASRPGARSQPRVRA